MKMADLFNEVDLKEDKEARELIDLTKYIKRKKKELEDFENRAWLLKKKLLIDMQEDGEDTLVVDGHKLKIISKVNKGKVDFNLMIEDWYISDATIAEYKADDSNSVYIQVYLKK